MNSITKQIYPDLLVITLGNKYINISISDNFLWNVQGILSFCFCFLLSQRLHENTELLLILTLDASYILDTNVLETEHTYFPGFLDPIKQFV